MAEEKQPAVTWQKSDGETNYQITASRFLKGHLDEATGVFHIHTDGSPSYVAATPEFPAVICPEAGHKVDREMRPVKGAKAKPPELKKHYNDLKPEHPQAKWADAEDDKAKVEVKAKGRPSDKSIV